MTLGSNGARTVAPLLKETLRSLQAHFRGRNGSPTVTLSPLPPPVVLPW